MTALIIKYPLKEAQHSRAFFVLAGSQNLEPSWW